MSKRTIQINIENISVPQIVEDIRLYMKTHLKGIVAITGPTTSGKSALSIEIAKVLPCEIISADSRQLYIGLDLGTNKIEIESECIYRGEKAVISNNIPHFLINILKPHQDYSVMKYIEDSKRIIKKIQNDGKIPLIVGGTGYYIFNLLNNSYFPSVTISPAIKKEVREMTLENMINFLKEKDPEILNDMDIVNARRLQSPIDFIKATDKSFFEYSKNALPQTDSLIIRLDGTTSLLYQSANEKLKQRFNSGLIEEVEHLIDQGVSPKWLESIGLEYKYISRYLNHECSLDELKSELAFAIHHYIKRQKTYMKKYL